MQSISRSVRRQSMHKDFCTSTNARHSSEMRYTQASVFLSESPAGVDFAKLGEACVDGGDAGFSGSLESSPERRLHDVSNHF